MTDLFLKLFLGHLVGDYLLQPREMALKKSEKSWRGAIVCAVHSAVYTASVCFFLGNFHWPMLILVFFSHYPVDRWSLGSAWLKLVRGRNFFTALADRKEYYEVDVAFSCLVYERVDLCLHLLALYAITRFL